MSSSREGKSAEKTHPSNQQNHTHNNHNNVGGETADNLRNNKSKSRSPRSPPFSAEREPFFKDFYERTKHNRPRLSERIFNKGYPPSSSIFENDKFTEDLRKQFEEEKKMFFDSDPFGNFPSHHRGSSPAPGGHVPGSGSPRMGRAGAGFPFESARSRFEDFPGPRNPMFSTMRRPAWEEDPFAGHTFNRERHNSGSSGGASGSSSASAGEEHIIPIRIERSDGTSTTNAHAKAAAKATASAQNSNPISTEPIPMPAPEGMNTTPASTPETRPPQPKMQQMNIPQRSSTEVRKSPSPAPGERSPRAQSAPPESVEGAVPKKFVSSINIEPKVAPSVHVPQPHAQFGAKCTKEKTPPKSNVDGRPIPIFVEGRGPVINNQRREPSPAPHPNEQSHNGTHQQVPKASRPAEPREVTPPPKKQAPPKDALEKVADITSDVKEWEAKVDQFAGKSGKNKEYLYLDEMLTRELIKLDLIETEGREDVRQARKDCIKLIQSCIAKLDSKIKVSEESQKMETDQDLGASGDHAAEPAEVKAEETSSQTQNTTTSAPSASPTPTPTSEPSPPANASSTGGETIKVSG